MAHCSQLHPKAALQQIQLHWRDPKAHEVRLCLCLVSCYQKKHVMGERGRGREREWCWGRGKEGGLESTADNSSDLTTWGKPHQGHWSHTQHTSLSTEEFHCLTDPNQSHSLSVPDWIILILVWQKVKYAFHLYFLFSSAYVAVLTAWAHSCSVNSMFCLEYTVTGYRGHLLLVCCFHCVKPCV